MLIIFIPSKVLDGERCYTAKAMMLTETDQLKLTLTLSTLASLSVE